MRRLSAALAGVCLLALPASGEEPTPIEITASAIAAFDASGETRFDDLAFVGGFEFDASDGRLRGISSFRFRPDGAGFLAVTDTGLWFDGRIERDGAGAPVGMSDARIAPILDADGQAQDTKGNADAEGLALDGDRAIVSFERDHRIETFEAIDPMASLPTPLDQPIPQRELRSNAGLETIAVAPDDRIITITEQSIDDDGNLFAAILGPDGGLFKVQRETPWHATDGVYLPGGDFLLLERRYESFGRVGMRIRRIAGETITVGALVDGPVIMEADLRQEIDNMEALDVRVNAAGETILALLSDDNGSFFQRNVYLEFRLIDGDDAESG